MAKFNNCEFCNNYDYVRPVCVAGELKNYCIDCRYATHKENDLNTDEIKLDSITIAHPTEKQHLKYI